MEKHEQQTSRLEKMSDSFGDNNFKLYIITFEGNYKNELFIDIKSNC